MHVMRRIQAYMPLAAASASQRLGDKSFTTLWFCTVNPHSYMPRHVTWYKLFSNRRKCVEIRVLKVIPSPQHPTAISNRNTSRAGLFSATIDTNICDLYSIHFNYKFSASRKRDNFFVHVTLIIA